MRPIALAAIAAALVLPAFALAADAERTEAARVAMAKAAINPSAVSRNSEEVLCHAYDAEIGNVTCSIYNASGQDVGYTLLFFHDLPPEKGLYLIDNCSSDSATGPDDQRCTIFAMISPDGSGSLLINDFEPIAGF